MGDVLMASPPPNIAGLIELRGIGIVQVPVAAPAPVALVLELGTARDTTLGERLPETPLPRRVIGGVAVPVLRFDPGTIAPAQRAEWALALHGTNANPPSFPPPRARTEHHERDRRSRRAAPRTAACFVIGPVRRGQIDRARGAWNRSWLGDRSTISRCGC